MSNELQSAPIRYAYRSAVLPAGNGLMINSGWKQKLKIRLPALALLLVTALFWGFYDRYEVDGPILLGPPTSFDDAVVRGDVFASAGRFVLSVQENGKAARADFPMPDATKYNHIRVRARLKTDGVLEGKYSWRCARVLLLQYEAEGKWISGHHGVVSEHGTKGWKRHEEVFEIHSHTARVTVTLQQGGLAGTAEFDRIEACPVRIRNSFVWWRLTFFVLWISAAIIYFPRCRLHKRRLRILILLNAVAILAGSLMPADWLDDSTQRMSAEWKKLSQSSPAKQPSHAPAKLVKKVKENELRKIDKFNELIGNTHRTGHFLLFASLCFLLYLSALLERQPSRYFFKVGFDLLLFAAVTEALQFLTLDRSAGAGDLLVDVCGMATALLFFLAALPLMRRLRAQNTAYLAGGV